MKSQITKHQQAEVLLTAKYDDGHAHPYTELEIDLLKIPTDESTKTKIMNRWKRIKKIVFVRPGYFVVQDNQSKLDV